MSCSYTYPCTPVGVSAKCHCTDLTNIPEKAAKQLDYEARSVGSSAQQRCTSFVQGFMEQHTYNQYLGQLEDYNIKPTTFWPTVLLIIFNNWHAYMNTLWNYSRCYCKCYDCGDQTKKTEETDTASIDIDEFGGAVSGIEGGTVPMFFGNVSLPAGMAEFYVQSLHYDETSTSEYVRSNFRLIVGDGKADTLTALFNESGELRRFDTIYSSGTGEDVIANNADTPDATKDEGKNCNKTVPDWLIPVWWDDQTLAKDAAGFDVRYDPYLDGQQKATDLWLLTVQELSAKTLYTSQDRPLPEGMREQLIQGAIRNITQGRSARALGSASWVDMMEEKQKLDDERRETAIEFLVTNGIIPAEEGFTEDTGDIGVDLEDEFSEDEAGRIYIKDYAKGTSIRMLSGENITPYLVENLTPHQALPGYRGRTTIGIRDHRAFATEDNPYFFQAEVAAKVSSIPNTTKSEDIANQFGVAGGRIFTDTQMLLLGSGDEDKTGVFNSNTAFIQRGYVLVPSNGSLRVVEEFSETTLTSFPFPHNPVMPPLTIYNNGSMYSYITTADKVYVYRSGYPETALTYVTEYAVPDVKAVVSHWDGDNRIVDFVVNNALHRITPSHDGTITIIATSYGAVQYVATTPDGRYIFFTSNSTASYNPATQAQIWSIDTAVPLTYIDTDMDGVVEYVIAGKIYSIDLFDGVVLLVNKSVVAELQGITPTKQFSAKGVWGGAVGQHMYQMMIHHVKIIPATLSDVVDKLNDNIGWDLMVYSPSLSDEFLFNGFYIDDDATYSGVIDMFSNYVSSPMYWKGEQIQISSEKTVTGFTPAAKNSTELVYTRGDIRKELDKLTFEYGGYAVSGYIVDTTFSYDDPLVNTEEEVSENTNFVFTKPQLDSAIRRYLSNTYGSNTTLTFTTHGQNFDIFDGQTSLIYNDELFHLNEQSLDGSTITGTLQYERKKDKISGGFSTGNEAIYKNDTSIVSQPVMLPTRPLSYDLRVEGTLGSTCAYAVGIIYGDLTQIKVVDEVTDNFRPAKLISYGKLTTPLVIPRTANVLHKTSVTVQFTKTPDLRHLVQNTSDTLVPSTLFENVLYVNGEWIQFLTYEVLGSNTVQFNTLLRGRRGSKMAAGAIGDNAYLYDPESMGFVNVTIDKVADRWVDGTGHRVESQYGQIAAQVSIVDNNMMWEPNVHVVRDGQSLEIRVRSRFCEHIATPIQEPVNSSVQIVQDYKHRVRVHVISGDYDDDQFREAIRSGNSPYIVRTLANVFGNRYDIFRYTAIQQSDDGIASHLNSNGKITLAITSDNISDASSEFYRGTLTIEEVRTY